MPGLRPGYQVLSRKKVADQVALMKLGISEQTDLPLKFAHRSVIQVNGHVDQIVLVHQ